MAIPPISDLAQAIGRLEGAVDGLRENQERILDTLAKDLLESRISQKKNTAEIFIVRAGVESLQRDMSDVKPFTEKLKRWQLIGLGAFFALAGIGSFVGSILQYFKTQIIAFFN